MDRLSADVVPYVACHLSQRDLLSFREAHPPAWYSARRRIFSHPILTLPSEDATECLKRFMLVFFDAQHKVIPEATAHVKELTIKGSLWCGLVNLPWILLLRARHQFSKLSKLFLLDLQFGFDPSDDSSGSEYLDFFSGLEDLSLRNVTLDSNFPDIMQIVDGTPSLQRLVLDDVNLSDHSRSPHHPALRTTNLTHLVYAGISDTSKDGHVVLRLLQCSPALKHVTIGFAHGKGLAALLLRVRLADLSEGATISDMTINDLATALTSCIHELQDFRLVMPFEVTGANTFNLTDPMTLSQEVFSVSSQSRPLLDAGAAACASLAIVWTHHGRVWSDEATFEEMVHALPWDTVDNILAAHSQVRSVCLQICRSDFPRDRYVPPPTPDPGRWSGWGAPAWSYTPIKYDAIKSRVIEKMKKTQRISGKYLYALFATRCLTSFAGCLVEFHLVDDWALLPDARKRHNVEDYWA